MKIGDLVRFQKQPDPATGVIVQIRAADYAQHGRLIVGVIWNFWPQTIVWQQVQQLEIINESG